MRIRCLTLLHLSLVVALLVPAVVVGQGADWELPRTADGHPDLQGVWANNNATPLERPPEWAGKATLTAEELAELQNAATEAVDEVAQEEASPEAEEAPMATDAEATESPAMEAAATEEVSEEDVTTAKKADDA